MADSKRSQDDQKQQPAPEMRRTISFYAMLMAAVGCVNIWIYWARDNKLSLVVAIVAFVGMVGWLIGARTLLSKLDGPKG